MANRVLLLLAMASANDPHTSTDILTETSGINLCFYLLKMQLHILLLKFL